MNLLADLIARLRSFLRRGREDADTEAELRFHLEMETAKNVRAGMNPEEARRQAGLRLGGVDAIREAVRDARGGRPLEDLLRDFGYALRGARRNPAFTLAAIVSLAIPHRLQHHHLHDRRLGPVPPAAAGSSRAARRRLYQRS